LRTLPFDRIKIDRSFVSELRNKDSGKIVGAIISLGDGSQMPITAEGIENDDILAQLREMGKDITMGVRRMHSRCLNDWQTTASSRRSLWS